MGQDGARQQPDPANIHVEGLVPLFFGNLLGGADVQHTCIVDEDVGGSKSRVDLFKDSIDIGLSGNIACADERSAAQFLRE